VTATDPEVPGSIPGHYKRKRVVGLERGSLSLVSTTEELLGRNRRLRSWIRPQGFVKLTTWHPLCAKLALTSLTSGGRSVGIFRLRTVATDFFLRYLCYLLIDDHQHMPAANVHIPLCFPRSSPITFWNIVAIAISTSKGLELFTNGSDVYISICLSSLTHCNVY
jgi:hypothetical protein